MVIYTSRNGKLSDVLSNNRVDVDLLSHSDSKLLLCNKLATDVLSNSDSKLLLDNKLVTDIDDDKATEFLVAVEYLPLSITRAAAYIKHTGTAINDSCPSS